MIDISAYGLSITITASNTFPQGITITEFADDGDPIDTPSQQVKDKAMGLNGRLMTWSKANPILRTVTCIPGSEDDRNLQALLEANRVGQGKRSVNDIITMVTSYPDGRTETCTQGAITDGMIGQSVASAGRLKTKSYQFAFENAVQS